MASSKTVAVIGGGPAGLVSAKHLLDAGLTPTVFTRSPRTGGMWDLESPLCWSSMRTNLSNYTCVFNDLPWPPEGTLDFPTHRQMGAYLLEYATRFIPHESLVS